ncbi:type IV secretory system conjugative DNA transfer family protein [Desulfofundulus sp. TPOSR]|uniref:type IV secretory system conjugative DNA transfer family protein n=1 Tax=Desulfofundulus sp. TPOSR TaxID=2714340 RepID=UPI00140E1F76|nr:type IV secretory system conjugative DNA transfer family protein [Desulfofundulus sp. TPOSR]NHM25968.1 type IV secretory system conjugative DNA transfer family protein [Desulfofundulus sp. TPOSR]
MSKAKIATFAVLGLAGLALVAALPVGVLVGAAAFGAYLYTRRAAAALFPLALGVGLALAFWCAADLLNTLKHLGGARPAVPLDVAGWLTMDVLDPANRAARAGLILGALGGAVLALAGGRKAMKMHGPGVVQGRPVVEGGWADDKHLADLCEFGPPKEGKNGGGIVLGRVDGRIVRLPIGKKGMACHTAVFGSSGSGKTFGFVYPNIISAVYDGASIVLSDPKGELLAGKYNKQGEYEPGIAEFLKRHNYDILVFNLKNPASGSNGWNPIMEAQNDGEFRQVCEAMIQCAGKESPFFAGGETNLFTALCGLVRYNSQFRDEWRHMRTVFSLLAWPVEALDAEFEREYRAGNLPVYFYEKWNSSKTMFNNFATGVANKVAVMTDGLLAGVLAKHDIDLLQVAKKKTALFCILPTMGDLRPVLTAFYFLMFKRLVNFAEENRGTLPVPVRFILDEFANIGRIPDFNQRVSFDRGLGITYVVIMQALTQFASLYGAADADTILGQMDVRMSLRVNDIKTARYFCEMFGKAKVLETTARRDVTMPWQRATEITKRTESVKEMALMEPPQMLELPFYTATARIPTKRPLFMTTVAFSDLKEYRELPQEPRSISDYAPPVSGDVPVPPIPEAGEDTPDPPDRKRKRSGGGSVSVDDLFSGTPDFD